MEPFLCIKEKDLDSIKDYYEYQETLYVEFTNEKQKSRAEIWKCFCAGCEMDFATITFINKRSSEIPVDCTLCGRTLTKIGYLHWEKYCRVTKK